jgi:hypothetical protein
MMINLLIGSRGRSGSDLFLVQERTQRLTDRAVRALVTLQQ